MTKAEKVEFVINTLQKIYPEIPIPLIIKIHILY